MASLVQLFEMAKKIPPELLAGGALRCACSDCRESNRTAPMAIHCGKCGGYAAVAIWHFQIAAWCPKCGHAIFSVSLKEPEADGE